MSTNDGAQQLSRRRFLSRDFPAGALLCVGCQNVFAATKALADQQASVQKPKYSQNSGMTSEEVFHFALGYCVPLFQNFQKKLGSRKFIELLEKASAESISERVVSRAKSYPTRDLKALGDLLLSSLSRPPLDKALTYEVIENSDTVFEIKFTECLMARLYREMNAADIGYAIECSPSEAAAKAFNPKLKLTYPRNIMRGDSICIERIVLDA